MESTEVLPIIQRAILPGHFVLTNGDHASEYFNKDAVFPDTEASQEIYRSIAHFFRWSDADAVIGPAIGGVILEQWVTYYLRRISGKPVFGVYAEQVPGSKGFFLGRDQLKYVRGKKVLVVDNNTSTGGSLKMLVKLVRELGGEVVGVGIICNNGGLTAEALGVLTLFAHTDYPIQRYAPGPDTCPLCRARVPISQAVGKGA